MKTTSRVERMLLVLPVVVCLASWLFLRDALLGSPLISPEKGERVSYLPVMSISPVIPIWSPQGFSGETVTGLLMTSDWQGHVYAVVAERGLFETQDGSANWTQRMSLRVYDITAHPFTQTIMYAATWSSYGMYWSQDTGNSWEPIPGWPTLSPNIYSVAIHPQFANVMFAGSGNWEPVSGEIFKSTNEGKQWYLVSEMYTNALTFEFDPASPDLIYAGTQYRGVLKSVNMGESWFPVNDGLPGGTAGAHDIRSLILNPHQPQQLFVATSRGVYLSENAAEAWQPLWEGIDANSIVFHPDDTSVLYLGTEAGLYASYDRGLTWLSLTPSGISVTIHDLAFDPFDYNKLWIATADGIWLCTIN